MPIKSITIIGSGSFGTALAYILSKKFKHIYVTGRCNEKMLSYSKNNCNNDYLPKIKLPKNIIFTTKYQLSDLIILTFPSSAINKICLSIKEKLIIPQKTIFLSCIKGIETQSKKRMSEIIKHHFPQNSVATLGGPNHAEEIAKNLPASTVIACKNHKIANNVCEIFKDTNIRAYANQDIIGVELGGAIKNIFAIDSGLSYGLKLGDNARASLLARGLAEMKRIGIACGAKKETFSGISGVGDLMATCYSNHSRNFKVGCALAQGKPMEIILKELGMVAEGVQNTKNFRQLANSENIYAPLVEETYQIIFHEKNIKTSLRDLLARKFKNEVI